MAKQDSKRRDYVHMYVRVPPDVKAWIERQSQETLASQNAEVIRALRAQIKQQARDERA